MMLVYDILFFTLIALLAPFDKNISSAIVGVPLSLKDIKFAISCFIKSRPK
jgi:hypothetical protein